MNKDELILENILATVKKELEFAERKNTYIFSLTSLMVVFAPIIDKLLNINCLLKISILVYYILYFFIFIFTLSAFFPRDKMLKDIIEHGRDKKLKDSDNLLFFGDISKYSVVEYNRMFSRKYGISNVKSKYKDDLIAQIIVNSYITRRKFRCFKVSAFFVFFALLQFMCCLMYMLLFSK